MGTRGNALQADAAEVESRWAALTADHLASLLAQATLVLAGVQPPCATAARPLTGPLDLGHAWRVQRVALAHHYCCAAASSSAAAADWRPGVRARRDVIHRATGSAATERPQQPAQQPLARRAQRRPPAR